MKSNLVSASILAVSALAFFGSASSFAEGRDPFPQDKVAPVSGKTRAEVKAEIGTTVSAAALDRDYPVVQ